MKEEEEFSKKTVADIIIEKFLKDVEETGTMPWQRPYERYNSFNYFTKKTYRGINRLLLPFGEYVTKNQLNEFNKTKKEDFRFIKGIEWSPVVYFTKNEYEISFKQLLEKFENADIEKNGYVGSDGVYNYAIINGKCMKYRNVLKYYTVCDIKWLKNSKGESLPSRIETGEVVLVKEEPLRVIQNYLDRSVGLTILYNSLDTPCYTPILDRIELNSHHKDEDSWYSTAFHEIAHSTGHSSRLNRLGVTGGIDKSKDVYAQEECIAEITASLLCAECGLHDFQTSESNSYKNNLAYVQGWKKKVTDWGKSFVYIVSQADKAFNYILGDDEDINR